MKFENRLEKVESLFGSDVEYHNGIVERIELILSAVQELLPLVADSVLLTSDNAILREYAERK